MYDTNTVAIVRKCFSERSAPEIGFLRPHIAHDHIVSKTFEIDLIKENVNI
jgi:hypothetical protein